MYVLKISHRHTGIWIPFDLANVDWILGNFGQIARGWCVVSNKGSLKKTAIRILEC